MIDTTKLHFGLVIRRAPVAVTLIQGHGCARKQKELCQLCLQIQCSQVDLDRVWYAVELVGVMDLTFILLDPVSIQAR